MSAPANAKLFGTGFSCRCCLRSSSISSPNSNDWSIMSGRERASAGLRGRAKGSATGEGHKKAEKAGNAKNTETMNCDWMENDGRREQTGRGREVYLSSRRLSLDDGGRTKRATGGVRAVFSRFRLKKPP